MPCINYAHRGASEEYPENTLYSFYMGLEAGADGIETDIQRTKDGVLVLFHDDTLERLLNIKKSISEMTYQELLQLDFGACKAERFSGEKIVTLEEFLLHFGAKSLTFALEIKQLCVEKDTLDMIDRFGLKDKVILTSFLWDSLVAIRKLDPDIRVGYLTEKVTPEMLDKMKALHMNQICPCIGNFSDEMMALCKKEGFSIRFWGVNTEEKMRRAVLSNTDGMTVNHPAALTRLLREMKNKAD